MTKLTNKQQWVLDRIIAEPWETMKEISEASPTNLRATEEMRERLGDRASPDFVIHAVSYQEVVVAVKRLLDADLIERDPGRPPYRHGPRPLALEVGDDPLEQAFAAPATKEKH